MKVKCLKMCLRDGEGVEREIARAYADRFEVLLEPGPFMPDLRGWYEDCFFNVEDSATFEQRFQRVAENHYFCFSKPALKLYACEVEA